MNRPGPIREGHRFLVNGRSAWLVEYGALEALVAHRPCTAAHVRRAINAQGAVLDASAIVKIMEDLAEKLPGLAGGPMRLKLVDDQSWAWRLAWASDLPFEAPEGWPKGPFDYRPDPAALHALVAAQTAQVARVADLALASVEMHIVTFRALIDLMGGEGSVLISRNDCRAFVAKFQEAIAINEKYARVFLEARMAVEAGGVGSTRPPAVRGAGVEPAETGRHPQIQKKVVA